MGKLMMMNNIKQMIIISVVSIWLLVIILFAEQSTAADGIAKPGCVDSCGGIEVPYPFGIDNLNCAKNQSFLVTCNYTAMANTSTPILQNQQSEIISNISLDNGTITIIKPPYVVCFNRSGDITDGNYPPSSNLTDGPFTVAGDSRNKFTGVGCNNLATLYGGAGLNYSVGCVSFCIQDPIQVVDNFNDSIGYCQTGVPMQLKSFDFIVRRAIDAIDYDYPFYSNRHCIYAFIVDSGFNLSSTIHASIARNAILPVPLVLEWVVGDNCSETACAAAHSHCLNSVNGQGYRCYCQAGYQGNPYLPQGCQDINECAELEIYPCHGSCKNTPGNYTCSCPLVMHGDGKIGCQGIRLGTLLLVIGSIISSVIVVLLVIVIYKKKKKEKNFMKHGGAVLKNQIKFFKEEELRKATNNYTHLLGQGGFGSVYKGEFNNVYIAVKKPREVHKSSQILNEEFQHEISIISQVNHKNVVKLLGICLETKIPLLVYEYVSDGTVFEHIHRNKSAIFKSWKNCLKIAEETASALNYLHSLADPPIIHRDVKSMNILLDSKHTAKVSDFGASVLIPPGQTGIATTVQGTFGYLDPVYLRTGTLTASSDVYSFGVVLVELLTGLNPIPKVSSGSDEIVNMVQYFISKVENGKLLDILNVEAVDEDEEEQIEQVAQLAVKCLGGNRATRPSMKEVADVLGMLMKLLNGNLQGVAGQNYDSEESESLLSSQSASAYDLNLNTTTTVTTTATRSTHTGSQTSDDYFTIAFDTEPRSISTV